MRIIGRGAVEADSETVGLAYKWLRWKGVDPLPDLGAAYKAEVLALPLSLSFLLSN
jgi:hypothetical protein